MSKMIEKIELHNFRKYKGNNVFDLTKDGVPANLVAIYAPNGSGKTSLLDAIEWVLFGEISRFEEETKMKPLGNILRNLEHTDGESYVRIIGTDKIPELRRDVKMIDGSDYNKGKKNGNNTGYMNNDKIKKLILPHHHIDSLIAADNPETRYKDWTKFWDSDENITSYLTCLNRMLKCSKVEIEKINNELNKLNESQIELEKYKNIVSKLNEDIVKFNLFINKDEIKKLSWENSNAEEYNNFIRNVNILKNENSKKLNGTNEYISTLHEYVDNHSVLEEERSKCLELKRHFEKAIAEYEACNQKEKLEIELDHVKNEQEHLFKEHLKYSELIAKGHDLFEEAIKYISNKKSYKKINSIINILTHECRDKEVRLMELENNCDEFRKQYEQKEELKLLKEHSEEISDLVNKINLIYNEVLELKNNLKEQDDVLQKRKKDIDYYSECLNDYNKINNLENILKNDELNNLYNKFKKDKKIYDDKLKEYNDIISKIEEQEVVFNSIKDIVVKMREKIQNRHLSKCPFCNTEFESEEKLLDSSFSKDNDFLKKLNNQRILVLRELDEYNNNSEISIHDLEKFLKQMIEKLNEEVTVNLINQKKNIEIQISAYEKEKVICLNKISEIKRIDENNNLFLSEYNEEGIKKWYETWENSIKSKIDDYELNIKNTFRDIQVQKDSLKIHKENLEKYMQELQKNEINTELMIYINNYGEIIIENSFEKLEKFKLNLGNEASQLDVKKEKLEKDINEFNDIYTDKKEWYKARANENRLLYENKEDSYKNKIKRYREFLNKDQLDVDFVIKEIGSLEKNRLFYEESSNLLSILEYNPQIENYIGTMNDNIKKMRNLEKNKEINEIAKKKIESIISEMNLEIEGHLDSFFSNVNMNNIYEKIEPHRKMKKLKFSIKMIYKEENDEYKPGLYINVLDDENKEFIPEWFFSTAQLNVVALSVFLGRALHMKDSPWDSIFIDDPIGHFDDMNILAFVDLLRSIIEEGNRQIILTTHDLSVFKALKRKLPEKYYNCRFYNLGDDKLD